MGQPEVTEFIIVPPATRLGEFVSCGDRFTAWLGRHFPRYHFTMATLAPLQDDEGFIAIPIRSMKSPDGDMLLCRQPDNWVMTEIEAKCREFEPSSLALVA